MHEPTTHRGRPGLVEDTSDNCGRRAIHMEIDTLGESCGLARCAVRCVGPVAQRVLDSSMQATRSGSVDIQSSVSLNATIVSGMYRCA